MKMYRMYKQLAGLLLALVFVSPVLAQDMSHTMQNQRRISVQGEGIVRVIPDQATVRFGIVTQSPDPEEARRRNAEASRDAMNAVRALGIEERKIRLETLTLQPAREYDPETRRWIEKGYEATRQVVVEINDLEVLPQLIAEVVQKGANRLDGIQYDLQNRDTARNEALVNALTEAREKARLMTSTLDAELGEVLTITEQQFDFPRPYLQLDRAQMAVAKDEMAAEPEAYAAGEIEVRTVVQVVFAIQ